jgi:hypothetical protein
MGRKVTFVPMTIRMKWSRPSASLNMIPAALGNQIPLSTPRRLHAQVRARLNHFYVRYQRETLSGEDSQGRIEDPLITSHGLSLDGSSDGHRGGDGQRPATAGGPETKSGSS